MDWLALVVSPVPAGPGSACSLGNLHFLLLGQISTSCLREILVKSRTPKHHSLKSDSGANENSGVSFPTPGSIALVARVLMISHVQDPGVPASTLRPSRQSPASVLHSRQSEESLRTSTTKRTRQL